MNYQCVYVIAPHNIQNNYNINRLLFMFEIIQTSILN